jgi:hypothetical protein
MHLATKTHLGARGYVSGLLLVFDRNWFVLRVFLVSMLHRATKKHRGARRCVVRLLLFTRCNRVASKVFNAVTIRTPPQAKPRLSCLKLMKVKSKE